MGDLFDAAGRGDRASQDEIARLVHGFSRALCRNSGPQGGSDLDWEDVAQEALRKTFDIGLRQYRGQGSERSYLYSIVKTTMIQMTRAATRRRRREETAAQTRVIPPHTKEPQHLVAQILGLFSHECRDLIERVFLHGEPYAQLALDLQLTESSVRSKVSRCIRHARTNAKREGVQ